MTRRRVTKPASLDAPPMSGYLLSAFHAPGVIAMKKPEYVTVLLTKDDIFIAVFKNAEAAMQYAQATGWIHQGVQIKGYEVNQLVKNMPNNRETV